MKKLSLVSLILIVGILAGCDNAKPPTTQTFTPHYPVTESRLAYAPRFEGARMYWLDNDRVFVPGYAIPKDLPRTPDGRPKEDIKRGLYIWDTRSNTYTLHAYLGDRYTFCYYQGFIRYTATDNHVMAGPMGEEKPQPENRDHMAPKSDVEMETAYSSCDPVKLGKRLRPEHADRYGKAVILLKEDHGYVTWDEEGLALYSPSQEKSIKLSILAKEFRASSKESYAEWAQQYVLIPDEPRSRPTSWKYSSWPQGMPFLIYALSPNGRMDTFTIPYGTWQPMGAYLTRAGLFWFSNNAPSTNSREAGGWLLQNGKMGKLFDHIVEATGVSPDGCKIAYANNDYNPKSIQYASVINVCQ